MIPGKKLPSPWLTPFDPKVLGLLRPNINQFSDGQSTILVPRRNPTRTISSSSSTSRDEDTVCIPVEVSGTVVDPVKDPYDVGDEITVTADGLSGTAPFTYQWILNGSPVSNSATFVHTLTEGDVVNKDGAGLGKTFIWVVVINACGIDNSDPLSSINVQGTP